MTVLCTVRLQTRKIATAAGTSTMAVYTHFGGMQQLITAVAEEGLRQFAIEHPHLYRLMFGTTSAHGISAPARNMLTLAVGEISDHYPSFAHVVDAVHRSMHAHRIAAGSPDDGATAVGPVLAAMTSNLLTALGDTPEQVDRSPRSISDRPI